MNRFNIVFSSSHLRWLFTTFVRVFAFLFLVSLLGRIFDLGFCQECDSFMLTESRTCPLGSNDKNLVSQKNINRRLEITDDSIKTDLLDDATKSTLFAVDDKDCDVLIDMRHAYDFSEIPLAIDDRLYHRIYSFNKAFQYLQIQGVSIQKYEEETPLSAERLAHCKVLFLNLPSADKEPFLLSELIAIRDFIINGGSAFFITDHTNCYFHQSRLKPLFNELDIEPQYYGVCDNSQRLGSGSGWAYFDRFSESPVTRNLRQIAFQTGGGVDPKDAVVWSSEESWQDAPEIPIYGEASPAFFGNFKLDKGERIGTCGVVLAKNYGKGKIVIVGDQNLFSTFFLQYLDNYRLWINSFAFLLDRPELADCSRYIAEEKKHKIFICWEELGRDEKKFGDPDEGGYYNIYTNLCRRFSPFCVSNDDRNVGLDSPLVLALIADERFSKQGVDFLTEQLRLGKTVLILDSPSSIFLQKESGLSRVLLELEREGITNNLNMEEQKRTIDDAEKKYCERIALSNGSSLVVLRGNESFDNSSVPEPESRVTFLQGENIKVLTNEINTALNSNYDAQKTTE